MQLNIILLYSENYIVYHIGNGLNRYATEVKKRV